MTVMSEMPCASGMGENLEQKFLTVGLILLAEASFVVDEVDTEVISLSVTLLVIKRGLSEESLNVSCPVMFTMSNRVH